jgi:hypothetical protein
VIVKKSIFSVIISPPLKGRPTKRHKKAAESYVLLRVLFENIKRPQDKTLLPAAAMSE